MKLLLISSLALISLFTGTMQGTTQLWADVVADDSGTASKSGQPVATPDSGSQPKSRKFRLNYGAKLTGLPENGRVRVWLPVPQANEYQTVESVGSKLPAAESVSTEPKYGNRVAYFETRTPASGDLEFTKSYQIQRSEVRALDKADGKFALTDEQRDLFLSANIAVPLTGKPLDYIKDLKTKKSPIDVARELYQRVDAHVKYDKSKPGYGNGDVLWVCDSRTGNCTDFHSLFISWARAKRVPAQFQIGFPLPPARGEGKIGGYHCWAMFFVNNKGWVPVDISEADKHPEMKDYYFGNLTENRVTFSTGRDIVLKPKQDGPPLNYFVYPYIEVDGKPISREQIELQFSFKDVE